MDLRELVELNDPDALLRRVDGLAAGREWDEMVRLQLLCRDAVQRGKQLWAVADHIDYRLALEAPGEWAGRVVTEDASRFLLGPLSEVVASRHTWAEVAHHIPAGPARTIAAHERVIRGEDLEADRSIDATVLEIPLTIEDWEPGYAVAEYKTDRAAFPTPRIPPLDITPLPPAVDSVTDIEAADALTGLVSTWAESSNGRVDIRTVEGTALQAIATLGVPGASLTELSLSEAMAWMAWTGASGGAYGRRRGAAAGRFAAWWVLAALTDLLDDWPIPGEELAEAGNELRWFAWSDLFPTTGWAFHLAVEDPDHHIAWAIAAGDSA